MSAYDRAYALFDEAKKLGRDVTEDDIAMEINEAIFDALYNYAGDAALNRFLEDRLKDGEWETRVEKVLREIRGEYRAKRFATAIRRGIELLTVLNREDIKQGEVKDG